MPNNPVQIVLNDDAFLKAPDPVRAGPDKDFFENNDRGFVAHRTAMLERLNSIEAKLSTWRFGPVAYVRVRMRPEAIAKSYRPSKCLFLPDQFPCVGAGAPGELFFRVPLVHMWRLKARFSDTEDLAQARISKQSGQPYHYVTRGRCELGAIGEVEIADPNAKRNFSAADALNAMLSPHAASGYVIELFEQGPIISFGDDVLGLRQSFETLQADIAGLGDGIYAALVPSPGTGPAVELLVTTAHKQAVLEDRRTVKEDLALTTATAHTDPQISRHEKVLSTLAHHPLVRRIRFPITIEPSDSSGESRVAAFQMPVRVSGAIYPKVGVIDTGISDIFAPWVRERHDFLGEGEFDPTHGTLVAGVLVAARAENGTEVGVEEDGCEIVDIPLMPRGSFSDTYHRGFESFLQELDAAIGEARNKHQVRVFNMSLNITAPVEQNIYSIYAARLDEIQDRHGVIIINSAGNLQPGEWRAEWPKTPKQAVAALAARTAPETILMPCESVRAVAVGAVNPPASSHLSGAPATYTRRGPGLRVGIKPDLAHYGGAGDQSKPTLTGLASCTTDGYRTETRGTSFAAPLVAKTLAALDVLTSQQLETRTLKAFAIHGASTPDCLKNGALRDIRRQFVGFGLPTDARSMLETSDHAITLVFESRLTIGERKPAILKFPLVWPASLVDPVTSACRGKVRMTLTYDAPIDQAFGTEFVRVNLDARLVQRQPNDRKDGLPSWHEAVSQGFLPKVSNLTPQEKSLIAHGLKWWPTKRYERDFGDGIGTSTEWQIRVESLVRAEAEFPAAGVPFSLIVTIEDPKGEQPIFNELHRYLQANRVDLHNLRSSVRLRNRT